MIIYTNSELSLKITKHCNYFVCEYPPNTKNYMISFLKIPSTSQNTPKMVKKWAIFK